VTEAARNRADLAAYTRIYEEHNARLVAYAVTLTGNPSTAEDLVAEAHFRVWRRISAGHAVENVPAYLAATIRNLAHTLHRTTAEIPLPADGTDAASAESGRPSTTVSPDDPSQRVAHVDYVTRLLKDLPERWVQALWLAEVEDLPLETVGRRIGANSNATAVLLNRAREGLRQAFLRGYPGTPAAEECAKHWQKMPSLVRSSLPARQTDSVRMHAEQCDDCHARLAALQQLNLRLPALLGPALLVFTLGGGALRLLVVAGGGGAVGTAKSAGLVGKVRHGASNGGKITVVSAGVLGSAAVAVAAVALTGTGHPGAAARTQEPASQPAKAAIAPAAKTASSKKAATSTSTSASASASPSSQPAIPKPAAAKPVTPPTSPPVRHAPRHAAPAPTTQTPVTLQPATSQPSPTPTPPPPSPTPPPDFEVTLTRSPLPEVTVTLPLPPSLSSKSPG
jgi:RNA polymerase sigma factor (sigma-70 family)